MKIIFKSKLPNNERILPGSCLELEPNKVNYIVGLNGTGKTITFSSMVHWLEKTQLKTKKSQNWMTEPPSHLTSCFQFEGFEQVTSVFHNTAKSRQSHWVDLDMALDSASGVGSLWSSEGQTNKNEFVKSLDHKDDPNVLYVFDEIDNCFDIKMKYMFFKIITKLRGTVVVCSHDSFFLEGHRVFDFTTGTYKRFCDYYAECCTILPPVKPV